MRPLSLRLAIKAACLAVPVATAAMAATPAMKDACHALAEALPGEVAFPNSTEYVRRNVYWSARQAELRPRCFVTPLSTDDVATAMKTLTALATPFTVKAGGHSAFAGASSIDGGVNVDLGGLNGVTVARDGRSVAVGPGSRWIDVSRVLDPLGLAIVGGRAADVGVAGISYFSGMRGWACDNVLRFRVVVASGRVVDASPRVNPDLYWALRGGGGSSFGIVTRFDLEAFPQGPLWTNSLVFPGARNATLVPLFQRLTNDGLVTNPAAHAYLVIGWQAALRRFIVLTSLFQAVVPPRDTTPPVFAPFQAVPNAMFNVTRRASVSELSRAIDQPAEARQTWWDTSVATTSALLLTDIVALYEARVAALVAAARGDPVTTYLVFQPVSRNVVAAMQRNGGNALGLRPADGALMIVQLSAEWREPRLDAVVEAAARAFVRDVERLARRRGLLRGFVYMNYAGSSQDVLARYGRESYARLRATAARWDPDGVLPALWRGYFQLPPPAGRAGY